MTVVVTEAMRQAMSSHADAEASKASTKGRNDDEGKAGMPYLVCNP